MVKKRVVITGGSGLLALNWACAVRESWDVVLGLHNHSVDLAGTSSLCLDLENREELGRQFESIAPDLIVHAAGLTSVDRCEEQPELARKINAEIAQNVAIVSAEKGIQLVHISTDHLFAGTGNLYTESEPVQPLNEYARSKALAELLVAKAHPEALIIRTNFFGWGHPGRQSFSDWLLSGLREDRPLLLFDDVYYTPILADNLALATHRLVEKKARGIFNVVGDQRLSKYEFGLALAKCFDLPVDKVRHEQVDHAKFAATRPKVMSLDNSKARLLLGGPLGSVSDFLVVLRAQGLSGRSDEFVRALEPKRTLQ